MYEKDYTITKTLSSAKIRADFGKIPHMAEFKTRMGNKLSLPIFFPDATRGVIKTLTSEDIHNTKTPGVLVNTYHLYRECGEKLFEQRDGVGKFMNWNGAIISDSGGFQVMSLAKKGKGKITDEGVTFISETGQKTLLTPELSISFQMKLKTDLLVVLDDFTPPQASLEIARDTVERTMLWAQRCKKEFEKQCELYNLTPENRPLLIGVVQGGDHLDLRRECAQRLIEIGFDGLGYGGWPIGLDKSFNFDIAKVISEETPKDYLLYGLGVGKPQDVVGCYKYGFSIFDCVLPTRDARHGRLYCFDAKSISEINLDGDKFYSYYNIAHESHKYEFTPVSTACDCLLCTNYDRAYLYHLSRIKEISALRLATIHNLRFYSLLMEKLRG